MAPETNPHVGVAAGRSLGSVFKAYDVRGTVPDELDEPILYAIGSAFARFAAGADPGKGRIVVGRDMRPSGEALSAAFMAGAAAAGAEVTDIGLCSTDLLYFATGHLDAPGAMLTASHNPARYNGVKLCLSSAQPVGEESGLLEVRRLAEEVLADAPKAPAAPPGVEHRDLLEAFAEHVRSFVDVGELAPLKVVADTANGMGGLVVPRIFGPLPFALDLLFGELDGNFPNHPADPIQAENLVALQARIAELSADVGLAFDGDADRVFLVDEKGVPLSGSTTTAIVAKAMLEANPGATILYNCICSRTVPEVIAEHGGTGVRTRVGHSFIKKVMADTGAVFGGEHSGHYYFEKNYRADSGIIAALIVLEELSKAAVPLSQFAAPFLRYADSGELNNEVSEPRQVMAAVEAHYAAGGGRIDHLDGLTVEFDDWWFNLRPSNTEPLLRLNVEAGDVSSCNARVEEVLAVLHSADSAKGA